VPAISANLVFGVPFGDVSHPGDFCRDSQNLCIVFAIQFNKKATENLFVSWNCDEGFHD